jgi:tRNA A-37 threonylcarbamoyl transferase component Bud32
MVEPTERVIADRYRLGPVIGRGGMATVHRAMDIRLEREVAVKLLRAEVSRDPDLAQRFRREALAATVLRHPNIVACLDTGTDGEQPFLVMDLVEGEDLAARLKRGGRLAPAQVARIGLDVARAMGVAHVRGIVHRDIKPGNILLAADGRAMVTDFGIAKIAMDAEASLPGTTLGSVHYFSPEQARGATTTPASDVYGLGLVLYEALTGERAWTGDSSDAIALARVGATAPSARDRRPEIPPELDAIVRRALSPEPADRYPSGAAMATALEAVVMAHDLSSPTMVVPIPGSMAGQGAASGAVGAAAPASQMAGATPAPAAPLSPAAPAAAGPDAYPRAPSRVVRGGRATGRRTGPPPVLIVALGLALVVGGLVWGGILGALPAFGDGTTAIATEQPSAEPPATEAPDPTPEPTPDSTAEPTPDPTPAPEPTPVVTPVPDGEIADLCDPFLDIPCGLGAGDYGPSRFEPRVRFTIGDGWSTVIHDPTLVALQRDEGFLTLASRLTTVFPDGEATTPRDRARDIIEAFIATDGVGASDVAEVRIGGRRGLSTDLTPTGGDRVELFATERATFYLEPDASTRVVAIDVRDATVVLVIEPSGRATLAEILVTADDVAGTIDWR